MGAGMVVNELLQWAVVGVVLAGASWLIWFLLERVRDVEGEVERLRVELDAEKRRAQMKVTAYRLAPNAHVYTDEHGNVIYDWNQ